MDALAWVAAQGMVLQSARGPLANLAEHVAGEPIRGSWWGHPDSQAIFRALHEVRDSPDVVALRLLNGKVTLVHRRLWPALVCLAAAFPGDRLAAVTEVHTAQGAHRTINVPFPEWVPADTLIAAARLDPAAAWAALPPAVRSTS